jgi:hypothetical protein
MTLDAHDKTRIDGFTARLVFSAAILQVVCGGIRFVDGSMLVQFSQAGFDARLQDFSQYLFDSPLKIMFLQALGLDSALTIGIIFLVLNFLPVAAVFLVSKNRQERTDLLLIVSVLPIWKLMFQNVGVGDAVMFAGAICLVVARQWMAVTLAAFVIVLWHFQQGAMIVLILCALGVVGQRPEDWGRLKAQIAGGMAGILVFVALTIFLIPPHTGRLGFIVAYMAPFLTKNIGLPHITMPGSKLEPGRGWPAFGLAEAERRADQMLAARSLLEPAGDSRLRNAGARHCSAVSSSRSAPVPRAAS